MAKELDLRQACQIILERGLSETEIAGAYRDGARNITNTEFLLQRRMRQKMENDLELSDAYLTVVSHILIADVSRDRGDSKWADEVAAGIRSVLGPLGNDLLGHFAKTADNPVDDPTDDV